MGYKSDRKIEKQLNKQAKKLQKANAKIEKQNKKIEKNTAKLDEQTEKLLNSNLPAKEVGGFRKFLNKWKFRIGLGVVGILGIASIPNEKNDYAEDLNNNHRIESESFDEKETTAESKENHTASIKEIDIETGTVVVEVESKEEQTTDLRRELEKQTVSYKEKPKVEEVEAESIINKGKEEVGLEKDEDTPIDSVIATTENKGKEADEMVVEKIEPEPDTDKEVEIFNTSSEEQNTSENKIEQETTKTVIDLDSEEEIPNADEKEGMDLVIEHDKDDNVSIEDGTIIIEGDGDVVIGFDEIETTESETHYIEPVNPFDDWER